MFIFFDGDQSSILLCPPPLMISSVRKIVRYYTAARTRNDAFRRQREHNGKSFPQGSSSEQIRQIYAAVLESAVCFFDPTELPISAILFPRYSLTTQ